MTVVTRRGPLREGAKGGDDLLRGGHPSGALVGVDLLAVGVDVKGAGAAHLDFDRRFEFALDVVLQAHGLDFDVVSEKAALNDDVHESVPPVTSLAEFCGYYQEDRVGVAAESLRIGPRLADY